jgi:hypothetical protein
MLGSVKGDRFGSGHDTTTAPESTYYGFSQLSSSEFLKREMEMYETKNHLLCGWCNKCL